VVQVIHSSILFATAVNLIRDFRQFILGTSKREPFLRHEHEPVPQQHGCRPLQRLFSGEKAFLCETNVNSCRDGFATVSRETGTRLCTSLLRNSPNNAKNKTESVVGWQQ